MNKITLTIFSILVGSGLVLSACTSKGTSADLPGSSWSLVSYGTAGNQTPSVPRIDTSLTFGKNGQASGNLGCNSFSGDYEVKDGNIVFSPVASTLMACPEPQMAQEGTAFQVMTGTVRFEVKRNTLTIHDSSGAIAITLSRK